MTAGNISAHRRIRFSVRPGVLWMVAALLMFDRSVYMVYTLIFAAAHEAAHVLALRAQGARIEKLEIGSFRMVLTPSGGSVLSYGADALVSLAGPLMNILLAGVILICIRLFGTFSGSLFMVAANLGIAGLNLLPIRPLDGSAILQALLLRHLAPERADRIGRRVSLLFLLPVAYLGVRLFLSTGFNLSLAGITVVLCRQFLPVRRKGALQKI